MSVADLHQAPHLNPLDLGERRDVHTFLEFYFDSTDTIESAQVLSATNALARLVTQHPAVRFPSKSEGYGVLSDLHLTKFSHTKKKPKKTPM